MYIEKSSGSSLERNNQHFIDFFFDILNLWAGYHPLNNHEIDSGKSYIHPVLIIEGLDGMKGSENDINFTNFYEYFLLKLHTECNNRTHFPVIIATSRSYYHHKEIYNVTNVQETSYPSIDFNL